ncbi:MAG TPA: tetratricopeptide repeat protein [Terracidiphilus sp.]
MATGSAIWAQAPASPRPDQPDKKQDQTKPAQPPSTSPSGTQANPFPEDTKTIPVLPSGSETTVPEAPSAEEPPHALPGSDVDPVRSPDEAPPDTSSSGSSGSSSSSADIANIVAPPPDDETEARKNGKNAPPEHKETAQEDENVGSYYLDQKNWRAALSRFQSALVLDPDNPDVYWGLAEAQRHLGDAAKAKASYMKLIEYDPDSKHAKEAKKLLKDPEMAKASGAIGNKD